METINYNQLFRSHLRTIVAVVLVVVLISTVITALQPKKFRSSVQLLVSEEQFGRDSYSAIRSAEKINASLVHIVQTTSFINEVLADRTVNAGIFATDAEELKKQWAKTVSVTPVPETGLLKIDVYHTDKNQAVAIADQIAGTLVANTETYTGSPFVTVSQVDGPVTSRSFVQPNIFLNIGAAIVLGLLISIGYVLFVAPYRTERLEQQIAVQAAEPVVAAVPVQVAAAAAEMTEPVPDNFFNDSFFDDDPRTA